MTRSEVKQECKRLMIKELRDALRTPPCEDHGVLEKANGISFVRRQCAGCALMAEEWGKLQERLASLLRKEIAAADTRKSDGGQ